MKMKRIAASSWQVLCDRSVCLRQSGGDDKKAAGSGGSADGAKISMILKTTSAEYWQYVQAGAEAAAKDLGVTVDVKGATSETAYDEQQNMIETDVQSGAYDSIIIAPLQGDQAATLVKGTKTPIFAVDTNFDAPEVISFIGTGNEDAAAQGGKAAVEAAKAAGWERSNASKSAVYRVTRPTLHVTKAIRRASTKLAAPSLRRKPSTQTQLQIRL